MFMEPVILKNGSEEVRGAVTVIMLSLEQLIKRNPVAFYELVMKCRNPEHRFFGTTADTLAELKLLSDDKVNNSIRNVVLSAVAGEGLNMSLGSPFNDTK